MTKTVKLNYDEANIIDARKALVNSRAKIASRKRYQMVQVNVPYKGVMVIRKSRTLCVEALLR